MKKLVIDLLKASDNVSPLAELKTRSELSGKKWDAAMKALSGHKLIQVTVDGDQKTVHLIA